MQYRVGQRIRLLHESGEGLIISLLDKHHVEVDLGDDFPIDVHISELIAIDSTEGKYLGGKASEEGSVSHKSSGTALKKIGSAVFTISLAICPSNEEQEEQYSFFILNPSTTDAVFTCYTREKNKFIGMDYGSIAVGEVRELFKLSGKQLRQVKSFHFQLIQFVMGKSHPHGTIRQEIPWNKGRMMEKMRFLESLNRKGWIFSLTEKDSDLDKQLKIESEFMRIKSEDIVKKAEKVIDLHIEELVEKPWEIAPSAILDTQIRQLEKGMSEALKDNYQSLIIIHGLGEGVLRKEIRKRLRQMAYVQSFESADPKRFGNGATKVYFK